MKPLNIAVAAFSTHGGSGIVGFESARLLARRGHSVSFVSPRPPLRAASAGNLNLCTVHRIKHPLFSPGAYAWSLATTLLDLHQKRPIDLIHVHYAVPHAVSAALVRQTLGGGGPALVTTLHGTDVTQHTVAEEHRMLTRWALEQNDALVVPSLALQRAATDRFGFEAERFEVIHNFVDLDAFHPGDPPETPRLIHVSNLRPVKRGLDVIAIFERARASLPQLRLTIVGDGPDREAMESRVRSSGLTGAIDFAGVDVDVAKRLASASVFVLPSETESFGLAALEAMACALPVVGSHAGGLPEVVKHGEGGFLHTVGDVDAMAASVISLLTDTSLMAQQRAAARARATQIGDPNPILDQYESLYRSIV